jgi:hypothetical protein
MDRRAARLNRFGLLVVGLLLLAGGGLALARSLGAWGSRSDPLLTPALRSYPQDHGWFWYAVAAGGIVLALLGLAWLFAQLKSERLRALSLSDSGESGTTRMPAAAVTAAVEQEAAALPGVTKAKARLLGTAAHPRLMLTVVYGTGADLAALRRHLTTEVLPHVRTSLERTALPAVVRLKMVPSAPERTLV